MKTIKIIDLLNKIAKGEELPKKIKCDGVIYNYEFQNTITGAYEYRTQNYNCLMNNMAEHLYLTDILKNEVEIIDDDKWITFAEENKDIKLLRDDYIEEFENMSGERQQYVIKTLMEIAVKKM